MKVGRREEVEGSKRGKEGIGRAEEGKEDKGKRRMDRKGRRGKGRQGGKENEYERKE